MESLDWESLDSLAEEAEELNPKPNRVSVKEKGVKESLQKSSPKITRDYYSNIDVKSDYDEGYNIPMNSAKNAQFLSILIKKRKKTN